MALEVHIVLMRRRRVLGILGKPQTRDFLGMRHGGPSIDFLHHLHHFLLVGNAVEGL